MKSFTEIESRNCRDLPENLASNTRDEDLNDIRRLPNVFQPSNFFCLKALQPRGSSLKSYTISHESVSKNCKLDLTNFGNGLVVYLLLFYLSLFRLLDKCFHRHRILRLKKTSVSFEFCYRH